MGLLSRFLKNEEKGRPSLSAGRGSCRLLVGNWKCHKSSDEARRWLDDFARDYIASPGLDVVLAPTFICLESVSRHLESLRLEQVHLAAQDISPFPPGGYTGAVAADMIKGLAEYVIVGHSERRRYFHETNQDVTNKVTEAVEAGLRPIVCVDRPYAVAQLSALADLDSANIIVAYSPVDALSFRIPEDPELVAEAVESILNVFPNRDIIYGGSLTRENVEEYLRLPKLSGVFVGTASLEVESFLAIHRHAVSCLCEG